MGDGLILAGRELRSRLIVGTGKYPSLQVMREAHEASGAEMVTVAVRRERLIDSQGRSLLDYLDLSRYVILPNTAGCFSAEDAIRVSLLGRDLLATQLAVLQSGPALACRLLRQPAQPRGAEALARGRHAQAATCALRATRTRPVSSTSSGTGAR